MLPEEQELNRLESVQTELEEQVTQAELTLETSKTETAQFQHRYHQTVGRLYAQLDELDAQIARVQAGLSPDDADAQAHAMVAANIRIAYHERCPVIGGDSSKVHTRTASVMGSASNSSIAAPTRFFGGIIFLVPS